MRVLEGLDFRHADEDAVALGQQAAALPPNGSQP
jgi:hypothetical protein